MLECSMGRLGRKGLEPIRFPSPRPRFRGRGPGVRRFLHGLFAVHVCGLLLQLTVLCCVAACCRAAELDDARALLHKGEYEQALARASESIEKGVYGEAWHILKTEAELTLGKYKEAHATVLAGIEKYNWSVRLRWIGVEAARFAGESRQADVYADEIAKLVRSAPWRYTDAENLVALGNYALDQGLDAKSVQDSFFTRARRNNPLHREPILALGQLALDKHDFPLAADLFAQGLKVFPDDADLLFGHGLALAGGDREAAVQRIEAALERNPQHVDALLWKVDRLVEGERYDEAQKMLEQVLKINPLQPEALAFQAAMAIVQAKFDESDRLRKQALGTWEMNPKVDYVIGRELSQKYRFAEGSQYQKLALAMDADYLSAKKQLAEDLLRLGRETEGWTLAQEAYAADEYDVAMFNLVTLKDELENFVTLETDGFKVRMEAREAAIYGSRVLELLSQARQSLCEKYKLKLNETTLVEIFPQPNDFAVRTFGMPGADGFLGVCFGNVITANSPASQAANPTNWESVLWHEFAHVVTLNKTLNRMPRWLSEGISVYEERQRNPAWGEQMSPQYREMILSDETLTPVGKLSSAFLSPRSGLHLQFAYYESSLVVEFLIDAFGEQALHDVLEDLAVGMSINESLERRTEPLAALEEHFTRYARALAESYGKNVDWSEPDLTDVLASPTPEQSIAEWTSANPSNYRGLMACAQFLMKNEQWAQAKELLTQARNLLPDEKGGSAPVLLLAEVNRRLGDADAERELLWLYAKDSSDGINAIRRLLEIETQQGDWNKVLDLARMHLAVNPLTSEPHQALARAAEELGQPQEAARSLQALLQLAPSDLAGLHYRLAQQRLKLGESEFARRDVLMALEEAPRYRDALRLLLQLNTTSQNESNLDRPPSPPLPQAGPSGESSR